MPVLTLCLPPTRWTPKAPDSECNGNIARIRRISSNVVKTRLFIQIQPPSVTTFVSHLFAEDSGPVIPGVVAILPDFDGFLQISSKFDSSHIFSRHRTLPMTVLTLCLPPARWGPRPLDSPCSGNIARYWWVASNLFQTWLLIQILP